MKTILKAPPSHPVMFNGIFDDGEIMSSFLNSTGLFSIEDPNTLSFLKQSFEEGIDVLTPVMDLRVAIGKSSILDVEMQNRKPHYDMNFRLGYYLSKLIGKSQVKGKKYESKECVVIAVLNFTMYDDDKYLRTFMFKDEWDITIPYFKIIALELTKISYCDKNKLKKWMEFLNSKEPQNLIGDDTLDYTMDKAFEKAIKRAIELNADDKLAQLLDSYEKLERENASFYEAGKIEERFEIARKLKCMGISVEQIVLGTGLTAQEVEKL